MPESAVESGEESALALPEISGFDLLTHVHRPDDFIAFARRGLFAYDWSDVHRPAPKYSADTSSRPVLCVRGI